MDTGVARGLDPVAERLLKESRERRRLGLVGREKLTRWLTAAALLAVALPLALTAPSLDSRDATLLVCLLGVFAVASRVDFEIGAGYAVPTELVLVPMLFLLPPGLVPLLVAAGLVLGQAPEYVTRKVPLERVAVPIGNAWFSVGPALVVLALGNRDDRIGRLGILVLALGAQFAGDLAASIVREWFALRVSPRHLLRPLAWAFSVDACLAPVGLAVVLATDQNHAAVLLPFPLFALLSLFSRERAQLLGRELELSHAYRGTAFLLGDVVEADDAYTGAHSRAVVDLVVSVCDHLRLDERSRRLAEFAALLHDVGKIRIPSEIINKPGPLTPEERAIINTHTIEGEKLLTPIGGLLADVGAIVRSCHEHWDGRGYPDALAGEEIPLVARIVCACDAFNAMTTTRPYRKRRSAEAALAEIQACSGTQFDPQVVDALSAIV